MILHLKALALKWNEAKSFYWKRKLKDQFVESLLPEIVSLASPISLPCCTSCATDITMATSSLLITMVQLSDEQLNNLSKEALTTLVSSLQNQLAAMKDQLDTTNAQLMDQRKQLEIFAEQAICPFTIARKNFVLMESDHGADKF